MKIRKAEQADKTTVLKLLDEFRTDCIEQITGEIKESFTARNQGKDIYESLLSRDDYILFLLLDDDSKVVGIITGYILPMLRSGELRAEVEEFFVKKEFRGDGNAELLMDGFFDWCREKGVVKVNLESDNGLERAHRFYKKYGFESQAKRFVLKLQN